MNALLTHRPRHLDPGGPTGEAGTELDRFLEALHPGRMGPRLQHALGAGPATCHVLDAKYEPGLRSILLYEHAGRLVRGDLVAGDDGDASSDLVAPGVRLSRFPHDPEMPTLPQVMDAARFGPALAEALGCAYPSSGARGRLSLLRYRPGKRVTVLARLPGAAGRYVAKVYHDPAKAAAVAAEAADLAAVISGDRGNLCIAPTAAYLPDLSVVVQHEVAGTPLDALLNTPRATAARDAVAAAGRALAALHDAEPCSGRERSVEKELRRFVSRAERIASVDPRSGAVLGRVTGLLLTAHHDLPAARTGPVHGDCKPSQFLCEGERIYVMDHDHAGVSDQAADVGTFLASLCQLRVRRSTGTSATPRVDGLETLAARFLGAYLAARSDGPHPARIRWQEAVALQRKALRAFARAPRSPLVAALAGEADRCLDTMWEIS